MVGVPLLAGDVGDVAVMAGALGAFQGHYATDIPLLCAGSLLILTPTLIVFLIFQRQLISALLQGSLKG